MNQTDYSWTYLYRILYPSIRSDRVQVCQSCVLALIDRIKINSINLIHFVEKWWEKEENLTVLDVGPVDDDIVVSVSARLFVEEAGCMHQFVDDDTDVYAALIQRHRLRSTSSTNVAVAPETQQFLITPGI